jgi:hypothetical protein
MLGPKIVFVLTCKWSAPAALKTARSRFFFQWARQLRAAYGSFVAAAWLLPSGLVRCYSLGRSPCTSVFGFGCWWLLHHLGPRGGVCQLPGTRPACLQSGREAGPCC